MTDPKIVIGFNKDGEADFEISSLNDTSLKEMNELRAMCMVAIGIAEDQFRRLNKERSKVNTDNPSPST